MEKEKKILKKQSKFSKIQPSILARIKLYGGISLVILGLLTLMGYLNPWIPWLEKIVSFRLQYFFASLFLLFLFSLSRLKTLTLCCLPIFFINLMEISFFYFPYFPSPKGIHLKVMVANVYASNLRKEEVFHIIQKESPHILAILEVTPFWAYGLKEIRSKYPYQYIIPRKDNFGIALLTQKDVSPLGEPAPIYFSSVPSILGRYKIGQKELLICATHAVPPLDHKYTQSRNQQLRKIAHFTKIYKGDLVVLGDLNITPWAHIYRNFEKKGNLSNSRRGFGVFPTWPSHGPLISLPLDHILIRPNMGIKNTYRIYLPGSDHYALVSEIILPIK